MSSAKELFKLLRLPFASGEYLFQQLPQEHPDMVRNEFLLPYLEEAKQYHMMPARQSDFVSYSTSQRKSSLYEDVLIAVAGYKSVDNSTRQVSAYSLNRKTWSSMSMIPFDVGRGFATCTYGQSSIFISGGNRHSPYFLKFDGNTNKWCNLDDIPSRQVQHNMIAVDKSVFLLGGLTYARIDGMWQFQDKSQKNVHCYDIQEDKWREAGDLVHPVYGASCAVFRGKILIIGGKINCLSPERILAIQCYNPRSCYTTVITTNHNLQSPLQTNGFDNNILLVSIDKKIMHVDPERTTLREIGHVRDFESHSFGVARQQNKLFILGGRARNEEDRIRDCMVSYDMDSNVCDRFSMPFKRWDFGFVKIIVKKSFLQNEI
ncbi:hypothetical protein KUTeg_006440 [Tegillarca granosa]|uniref:Uncharacterized protein n=1 Tax=Tegillarca granosa TaxID=220873 RepID=A0ABQ9FIE9_TEGGR|nr:hypothetical protein KUTeg_006440 [Tegillarca granosa]